ncbi:hypothetical protein CL629_01040 [bacterium]|nr:hypothetical protein [bacterium]|tara:strand:+ start:2139 stop:2639 length:501 start_codon:yes stop_codon:yes gene_type:complete
MLGIGPTSKIQAENLRDFVGPLCTRFYVKRLRAALVKEGRVLLDVGLTERKLESLRRQGEKRAGMYHMSWRRRNYLHLVRHHLGLAHLNLLQWLLAQFVTRLPLMGRMWGAALSSMAFVLRVPVPDDPHRIIREDYERSIAEEDDGGLWGLSQSSPSWTGGNSHDR